MEQPRSSSAHHFEAAVERPLSVVFRTAEGAWEGHDYLVEVITSRQGLDGFDVVVDFRDLESALDRALGPFQGRLLSDLELAGPVDLARKLLLDLAPHVPAPARITEIAMTDGRRRRLALRP
jgi:6-pyruvoyl-tetrahydropterin synthase